MSDIKNKEEIKKVVREVVKEDITKIVSEELLKKEKKYKGVSLIERIIVVEQEIRNINKRLEDFFHYVDKRFEQMDKRFEQMLRYMDKRFEDLNKRINFLSWFVPTIITVVVVVLKFI